MSNFTTVICDLDGVVYRGAVGIAGAGEALATLAARGYSLRFATNNAGSTPDQVVAKIAMKTGFTTDATTIVTSAIATAHLLRGTVASAFVIGGPGTIGALDAVGIEVVTDPAVIETAGRRVDAVVVGLDRDLSYAKLAAGTTAVRAGARFVATNDDATFPTERGLAPGNGAIVASLVTSTGQQPEVCGKPHDAMAAALTAHIDGGPVLMVGDRVDTDMLFAERQGWSTALVLSGVTELDAVAPGRFDFVLGSIAELPAALDR